MNVLEINPFFFSENPFKILLENLDEIFLVCKQPQNGKE